MTIAACYLSPEGVVFGADSTTTFGVADGIRHYNFAQKVFEIGQSSTLGAVIWGMGNFPGTSHRTLLAEFADELVAGTKLATVGEVAQKWVTRFWGVYQTQWKGAIDRVKDLHAKGGARTSDEE